MWIQKLFVMDPVSLEKQITKKTRAIVPVHLYGQSAPMKEIMEHCVKIRTKSCGRQCTGHRKRLYFPGRREIKTGTIGTVGTTSFFPSKNLGAYGDGGALFTQGFFTGRNF